MSVWLIGYKFCISRGEILLFVRKDRRYFLFLLYLYLVHVFLHRALQDVVPQMILQMPRLLKQKKQRQKLLFLRIFMQEIRQQV